MPQQLGLDFEPLAPEPSADDEPRVWQVAELAGALRDALETGFGQVAVEGEISNWKRAASGHCYFTLTDGDAQLRCVMWRSRARRTFFDPQDGLEVRAHGGVSVYERRGELQVVVDRMTLAGEGALLKAFEKLKAQLRGEGLFDPERKRPLPQHPRVVGVVTSGSGAALHDVLTVLGRRYPIVRVVVCPTRVQGMGAAEEVAAAIASANRLRGEVRPDVLVVGRGGGSVEDLWAFNEEAVARALAASGIPTISAVGHETDLSIADLVADVRAATPSMAAELAVPDGEALCAQLHETEIWLRQQLDGRLAESRRELTRRSDDLRRAAKRRLDEARQQTQHLADRLGDRDPGRPLRRGYAHVSRDGEPVRSAAALHPGEPLLLRFDDGAVRVEVVSDTL